MPYLRVGPVYYKKIKVPNFDGTETEKLKKWSLQILKQDMERSEIAQIPKYDDFICFPSHIDFKQVVGNCYNIYKPLKYVPREGGFEYITTFLNHIFADQIEVGLDYLTILFKKPLQKLPALCLVSKEKKTGKSTFIDFMIEVFGANTVKVNRDSFSSQFNSDLNGKLIIAIEEMKVDSEHVLNKIKDLTTARVYSIEKKGFDREAAPFFGKLIINSNHVTDFIKIEDEDNRFWVREIQPVENEDPQLLEKMKKEVPFFLNHLIQRNIKFPRTNRFWFAPELTWTQALRNLRKASVPDIEKDLIVSLIGPIESLDLKSIQFTPDDLTNLLVSGMKKYSQHDIRRVLKNNWLLTPAKNSLTYQKITRHPDGSYYKSSSLGRFYELTTELLTQKYDELMN